MAKTLKRRIGLLEQVRVPEDAGVAVLETIAAALSRPSSDIIAATAAGGRRVDRLEGEALEAMLDRAGAKGWPVGLEPVFLEEEAPCELR